ncbi:MAG: hypothetical protein JJT75_04895, partial [Opitutales bacterium]|nr:hypothetical protein [Opitutales bacterium]
MPNPPKENLPATAFSPETLGDAFEELNFLAPILQQHSPASLRQRYRRLCQYQQEAAFHYSPPDQPGVPEWRLPPDLLPLILDATTWRILSA